jgi:hypothetical protein
MLSSLYRHRGLWVNLLFIAYFALLQPLVLARLERAIDYNEPQWLLGVILLAAPFLELAGFYLKVPPMLQRMQAQAIRWPDSLPIAVWMAHLVLTFVVLITGFFTLGLTDAPTSSPPVLGVIILVAVVVKEIWFLLYWITHAFDRPTGPARPARRQFQEAPPESIELLGDLLLMPFATLGFTSMWGMLIARQPIDWASPGDAAVELGISIFIFVVVFAAARSIYLIEERATLRGRWPVLLWVASFVISLLLALAGLPAG